MPYPSPSRPFSASGSHSVTLRRRSGRPRAIFALALILSLLFPRLALAINWPETVHVIEADVHRSIYARGSSEPMVNADLRIADGKGPDGKGTIFYCIDQSLNGADTHPSLETWQHVLDNNETALRGLVALLDAGAPNVNGAGDWSASIQATRYAIWAWMNTSGFASNTMTAQELLNGYEDNAAGRFAKSLYRIAEAGTSLHTGKLEITPETAAWTVDGERVTADITVDGSFDSFSIELPESATASPAGGVPGTVVTLSMPLAAAATEQTFTFVAGTTSCSEARYGWYSGSGVTQDLVGHPGQELLITDRHSLTLSPPLARIRIEKQGDDGSLIPGTIFEILRSGETVCRLETGTDGSVLSDWLTPGSYEIVERHVPVPYVLDPVPHAFDLATNGGQEQRLIRTNRRQTGRLILHKQSPDGSPIAGARFAILAADSEEVLAEIESDAEGIARSGELPLGRYRIRELFVPAPWLLDASEQSFELVYAGMEAGETVVSLILVNEAARGRIRLEKRDRETGCVPQGDATLAGTVYRIEDDNGSEVGRLTTDENGEALSPELPLGRYTLTEETAPRGYILDSTPQTVELCYADMRTPVVEAVCRVTDEVLRGSFRIDKTRRRTNGSGGDSSLLEQVGGVRFHLTLISDPTQTFPATSDENGIAVWDQLPYGDYRLEEETPVWARPLEPLTVHIPHGDRHGALEQIDILNESWQARIRVVKVDSETGEPIRQEGIRFRIIDLATGEPVRQTVYYPSPQSIEIWETDDTGSYTLPELLPYGEYRIEELSAPSGYVLNEETLLFCIDETVRDGDTLTLHFADRRIRGRIAIRKYSSHDGRPLAGVSFAVTNEAGEELARLVSDENGEAISGPLPYGVYTITETEPAGFIAGDGNRTVAVSQDDETVTLDIVNEPTAVRIGKSDASNGHPLPGAVFGILDTDGNSLTFISKSGIWRPSTAAGATDELRTDASGELLIHELPCGSYLLVERVAPVGYRLEAREIPFAVNSETGATTPLEVAVENEPLVVELTKQDITNAAGLPGATIRIAAADGTVVFEGITADDGTVSAWQLTPGSYVFYEELAPEGYLLSSERLSFVLHPDGRVESESLILYNRPTELMIRKETDGGEALAGVSFSIVDEHGSVLSFRRDENGAWRPVTVDLAARLRAHGVEVCTELVSDRNGLIRVLGLAGGRYLLEETLPLTGFAAAAPTDFVIDPEAEEESVSITVTNTRIPPPASVPTTGRGEPGCGDRLLGLVFLILAAVLGFRLRSRAARDRASRRSSRRWPHAPAADLQDR